MKRLRAMGWNAMAMWHVWRRDDVGQVNMPRWIHHHLQALRCVSKAHSAIHGELP